MGFKTIHHFYKTRCNIYNLGLNERSFNVDKVNCLRFDWDNTAKKPPAK